MKGLSGLSFVDCHSKIWHEASLFTIPVFYKKTQKKRYSLLYGHDILGV